jgi:hypothetical protein
VGRERRGGRMKGREDVIVTIAPRFLMSEEEEEVPQSGDEGGGQKKREEQVEANQVSISVKLLQEIPTSMLWRLSLCGFCCHCHSTDME